jgi:two-component system copper resistance phosphate regulon response regulator CusR
LYILLAEDQLSMMVSLKQCLVENDFTVDTAQNGSTGLELALKKPYHAILMDVMMPGRNGIDVCKILRERGITTPILLFSAMDAVEDKIAGLEAGADDYLAKPFDLNEFIARIRALIRRHAIDYGKKNVIIIGDLVIDMDTRSASRNNVSLELTKKEFRLLEFFIQNEGRLVSKNEIAEKVWDVDFDTGTNIVEVYVNYLRNKLDKGYDVKLIHTRFGLGYIFNPK